MKSSFCFDTAALVSLGHTDILPLIIDNFYVIISKGVLEELKDIARHRDDDSRSAKKWLDYQREFEIFQEKGMQKMNHLRYVNRRIIYS